MILSNLKEKLQPYYKKLYDEHATNPYATLEQFKYGFGYLAGAWEMMQFVLKAFEQEEEVNKPPSK